MRRKKTVLLDCRNLSYPGSGLCSYCEGVLEELASYKDMFNFVFLVNDKESVDRLHLQYDYSIMKAYIKKSNMLLRDINEQLVIPFRLLFKRIDVFHGFDYYVPIISTRYKKVTTIHDCAAFRELVSGSMRTKYRQFLQLMAAKHSDKIVTISNFSKKEIMDIHCVPEKKVVYSYNGVKKVFYQPVGEETKNKTLGRLSRIGKYILYYGGYRKNKNVGMLLKAFKKTHGYSLVLVGASNDITNVLNEAEIHDNRIVNWGFASDDEIKCLLDNCVAFVTPTTYEGFGLPVAEALSRGSRVICNDIEVLREVGGDDALYFRSTEELVSIIEKIENTPKPLKREFNYKNAVELYTKIYNE